MDDKQIREAAQRLVKSQSLVVLTGAGVSKESGVPTFRDALDGLWSRFDPQELATPSAFKANPKLVWDWYEHRREKVSKVKPNPGHYAIAELEDLLPKVSVITQNVDGLHQAAGSSDVITLHGDINRHKCSANCEGDPTLVDVTKLTWDREVGPPACPYCGALVRPDVVWFTERLAPEALERAIEISSKADVMLVVGTAGAVQPAASMPYRAKQYNNAFLIDINPIEDTITPIADLYINAPSGEVLPQIVRAMRSGR
jgi:NAD-dependent deacetylase